MTLDGPPTAYQDALRRCYNPDVPDTAAEAEARAKLSEAQAASFLRQAEELKEFGLESGRDPRVKINDLMRHHERCVIDALSYRRIEASIRRREQRRVA